MRKCPDSCRPDESADDRQSLRYENGPGRGPLEFVPVPAPVSVPEKGLLKGCYMNNLVSAVH